MIVYFAIFLVVVTFWLISTSKNMPVTILKITLFIVLLTFIGFRYEVGGDWNTYLKWFHTIESGIMPLNFSSILYSDSGYNVVNWISSKMGWGIFGVNTICAFLFLIGVFYFLDYISDRNKSDCFLGMSVLYPYMIVVVGMGYTRQSVALGLGMLALTLKLKNRSKSSFLLALISIFFHKTGIMNFLWIVLAERRRKVRRFYIVITVIIGLTISGVLYKYFIHYILNRTVSHGGMFRALILSLFSLGYIVFDHFNWFDEYIDNIFWKEISYISLLVSAMAFLNLTVGDRLLLYFYVIMPVFTIRFKGKLKLYSKPILSFSTFGIFLLVMTIWILFSIHSKEWIPYRIIFLE